MIAVEAKACSKCSRTKALTSFRENARYAGGRVGWCRECESEYRRRHYERNKDRCAKQSAEWYAANRDACAARNKANYEADKQRHIDRAAAAKARRPDYYRSKANARAKLRRASDPAIALRARIGAQINYCLSTGKGGATSESLLGYSMAELRTHLERQFVNGMGWHNMGEWHIDHIIPLSSFTITGPDDPELRRAWALPNLRPLWAAENLRKHAKRETLL